MCVSNGWRTRKQTYGNDDRKDWYWSAVPKCTRSDSSGDVMNGEGNQNDTPGGLVNNSRRVQRTLLCTAHKRQQSTIIGAVKLDKTQNTEKIMIYIYTILCIIVLQYYIEYRLCNKNIIMFEYLMYGHNNNITAEFLSCAGQLNCRSTRQTEYDKKKNREGKWRSGPRSTVFRMVGGLVEVSSAGSVGGYGDRGDWRTGWIGAVYPPPAEGRTAWRVRSASAVASEARSTGRSGVPRARAAVRRLLITSADRLRLYLFPADVEL